MKYIFLIIFLSTSISLFACEHETTNECSSQEVNINEENHSSSDECCNDFCTCKCCTKIPVIKNSSNLSNLLFFSTQHQITKVQILPSNFADHWQPPKQF